MARSEEAPDVSEAGEGGPKGKEGTATPVGYTVATSAITADEMSDGSDTDGMAGTMGGEDVGDVGYAPDCRIGYMVVLDIVSTDLRLLVDT